MHMEKSLHWLPKLSLKVKVIKAEHAVSVNNLFVIPIIIIPQGHIIEICTKVSEIHKM